MKQTYWMLGFLEIQKNSQTKMTIELNLKPGGAIKVAASSAEFLFKKRGTGVCIGCIFRHLKGMTVRNVYLVP